MKIAITGASGYVGGCIATALRNHGHEVLSLSRRPCPPPWFSYSLGDDPTCLPWNDVDAFIHAAYDFTARNWDEIYAKNIQPSIKLLQTVHQAGVEKLFFISSMSSFEGCHSKYGQAKLEIEKDALALGVIVIRPGLVWGNGSGGVMGSLEKLVTKLPIVPSLAGGESLQQYLIHESDLSITLVQLVTGPPHVKAIIHTLAHPNPVSLHTILTTIAKRRNLQRLIMPLPWQMAMVFLKLLEAAHIPIPFRSDSLSGLVHGNPALKFTSPPENRNFIRFDDLPASLER